MADSEAHYWQTQISTAEKNRRYVKWLDVAQKYYDRYLLESDGLAMNDAVTGVGGRMVYNLLWSNVQTQLPMLYSKLPEPYVARKFGNRDPIARMAAQIAERATVTDLGEDDFDDQATSCALDWRITGRGVLRVIYKHSVVNSRIPIKQEDREDGEPRFVTDQGVEIPKDVVEKDGGNFFVLDPQQTEERAPVQYHNWRDFLIGPGRKWSEVQTHGWIDWITYMTRADASKRFGEKIAKQLKYNINPFAVASFKKTPDAKRPSEAVATESTAGFLARIDEVWDARSKQVFWVSPGMTELLDKEPDFLGLKGFFNTPRPLLATTGNDNLIPVPDYAEYRSQAKELDDITGKIEVIVEEIRAGGVYDSSQPNLGTALRNKQGGWHGVDNFAKFAAAGGMDGAVQSFDINELIKAAAGLYEHRQNVKRDADEISGMIDLFRGQQTQKDETLGQSEIRAGMGGLRVNDAQRDFQRYLRDVLALKLEIIVSQFDEKTILEMADGQALIEESPEVSRIRLFMDSPQGQKAMQDPQQSRMIGNVLQQAQQRQLALMKAALDLLKSDRMRTFRLDIETDSTVAIDENMEKQQATDFVQVIGDYLERVFGSAAIEQNPELKPLAGEMLMFVVRRFKVGRSLEQKIEETIKAIVSAPPQPQQPDPLTMDVQRQAQKDQMEAQDDQEKNRIAAQKNAISAYDAATKRMDVQVDAAKAASDGTRDDLKLANEILDGEIGVAGNA